MQDIRQTKEWGRFLESQGWMVEKIKGVFVFIKKLPLLPLSVLKIQRWNGAFETSCLDKIRAKHRVIYTVLEPLKKIKLDRRYKLNKSPYLPSKTIIINLNKTRDSLWNSLSYNATRVLKNTLEIKIDEIGVDEFYKEWKATGRWMGLNKKSLLCLKKSFGDKCRLVISRSKNRPLSGIVLLESDDTVNYFQSWTNNEGRRLRSHYYLVWRSMLEAKKRGLSGWDFEGVFDSRFPQERWRGFSEFKKKFGGVEVSFPESRDVWF